MPTLYDFQVMDIEGEKQSLSDYAGKLCLIVNVASECGLTPQYDDLQQLYARYREDGFEVLGFPCNQFGGQEPGEHEEISRFCRTQYGVEFPMFGKLEVNGEGRAPLFEWLTAEESEPDQGGEIAWNFAKFLVDQEGQLIARFAPTVTPCAAIITDRIDAALNNSCSD
jgi:glutathione peroxidase